jgi:hypothetical protein
MYLTMHELSMTDTVNFKPDVICEIIGKYDDIQAKCIEGLASFCKSTCRITQFGSLNCK